MKTNRGVSDANISPTPRGSDEKPRGGGGCQRERMGQVIDPFPLPFSIESKNTLFVAGGCEWPSTTTESRNCFIYLFIYCGRMMSESEYIRRVSTFGEPVLSADSTLLLSN